MSNGTAEESDQDEPAVCAQGELSAEQGLKHLLLTVDVERLYRSGLLAMLGHQYPFLGVNRGPTYRMQHMRAYTTALLTRCLCCLLLFGVCLGLILEVTRAPVLLLATWSLATLKKLLSHIA